MNLALWIYIGFCAANMIAFKRAVDSMLQKKEGFNITTYSMYILLGPVTTGLVTFWYVQTWLRHRRLMKYLVMTIREELEKNGASLEK